MGLRPVVAATHTCLIDTERDVRPDADPRLGVSLGLLLQPHVRAPACDAQRWMRGIGWTSCTAYVLGVRNHCLSEHASGHFVFNEATQTRLMSAICVVVVRWQYMADGMSAATGSTASWTVTSSEKGFDFWEWARALKACVVAQIKRSAVRRHARLFIGRDLICEVEPCCLIDKVCE